MPAAEKFTSPLDNLRIAAPCPANWDEMEGDERKRFCRECKLNVYNLSGMSKREAEDLIQQQEGRLCVRMFQREDGTVITDNCPVGVRMLRRKLAWVAGGVAAGFFFAASGALALWGKVRGEEMPTDPGRAPVEKITQWINPPTPTGKLMPIAGALCPMPPPPPNKNVTPVPQNGSNNGAPSGNTQSDPPAETVPIPESKATDSK